MANGNSYIKLPVFITVIALLTSAVAGAYGFSLARSEAVRIEMKEDLKHMENRIVREIRSTRPRQ